MSKVTIGIDNGAKGSIGIIAQNDKTIFTQTPHKEFLHFTKKGNFVNRVDHSKLDVLLQMYAGRHDNAMAYLERPVTGVPNTNTCILGGRAYEAFLIMLEHNDIPYETVDSKKWQKALLGNVKGSANLKKASKSKGIQMYPQFEEAIKKQKDADGLLIAHYYHGLRY